MRIFLSSLMLFSGCLTMVYAQDRTLSVYNPAEAVVSSSGSITLLPGFHVPAGSSFHAYISRYNTTPLAPALSQNQNYIVTYTPREPFASGVDLSGKAVGEVMQSVQYFDGLGRALQTVQTKGSPGADKDIVIPMEYDAFGREVKKYLPYASTTKDGSYKADGLSAQGSFYQAPPSGVPAIPTPYAQTVFEASPLNRVLEQGAPGNPWQPYSASITESGHTVKQEYSTNTATGDRTVRLFRADVVTAGGDHRRALSSSGNYGASQLYLTITKDENWVNGKSGTIEEYKDKEGRVVLKRVWESESVSLSTYYVYDDFGDLSFVLPPGASPDAGVPSAEALERFCYQYCYDGRRRLIEKKLPGKGWEYMVYNTLDQLILSQDAVQRAAGKWSFIKYNALGAEVLRGFCPVAGLRSAVQSAADTVTIKWETYVGSGSNNLEGYNNLSYPTTNLQVMRVNYYDDYSFPGNPFGGQQGSQSQMTKGLLTGSKVRSGESGAMLKTALYYDDKGRVIQSKSENHLEGTDVTDNTYNFSGELTASTRVHTSPGKSVTIATWYDYDHMGRKIRSKQKINNENEVLLSALSYNDVGQLKEKSLHNGMQKIGYSYNERGWIKSMTAGTAMFDQYLRYNDPQQGAVAQWNGNISEQAYTSTHTGSRWFTYGYDKLNRLKTSAYSNANELGEELSYDQMGNISRLIRGGTGNGTLDYAYTGNRLMSLSGFKTGSYVYDDNGNMTTDGVRNVTIGYNALNLPVSVTGTGGNTSTATYQYDADGNKQRSVQGTTTRDYIAGIQYENGQISQLMTEEGRAVRNGNETYRYEYFLKDHLGNIRVTIDDQGGNVARVVQSDEYYAFGLNRSKYVSGDKNNYLYNGKEKQDVLTEQYDYGARFYDPVVGRWNVPDILAEFAYSLTPYRYCFNSPVNFMDPYGLWEATANGYKTDKKEDIERFMTMLSIEKDVMNNNVSMSQVSSFIGAEIEGGLGKLSDGTKLLSPLKTTAFRQVGGASAMYADKKSFDNFWHQVQGDLTPNALDTRTLGQNLLWTSYAGGNNPKTYRGYDDFSHIPNNPIEFPAIAHDQAYDRLGVKGLSGLATSRKAIGADWRFVAHEVAIAHDPRIGAVNQLRAFGLGVGLGIMALPKTIYELGVQSANTMQAPLTLGLLSTY